MNPETFLISWTQDVNVIFSFVQMANRMKVSPYTLIPLIRRNLNELAVNEVLMSDSAKGSLNSESSVAQSALCNVHIATNRFDKNVYASTQLLEGLYCSIHSRFSFFYLGKMNSQQLKCGANYRHQVSLWHNNVFTFTTQFYFNANVC